MRIALVTYAIQIGGIETFLKLLAKYFIEKGHNVDFVETLTKGKWSQVFRDEGYKVIQILSSPLHSRIHHAKRIAKILKDYDLIILNNDPFAQAVLGLLPEKTIIITVLHMYLTSMIRNATANKKNFDMLVTVSPAVRKSAVHFGIEEKKVVCIPNGIEVPDRWPKEKYNFEAEKYLRVIYIGALTQTQKGVLYLPGIFKKVAEEGISLRVDIVGDGPEKEKLINNFKHKCQNIDIVMHGALPNSKTLELLNNSHVLIMPSHFEGLPLVLLEAMSRGVVPIVSKLNGCTDFVINDGQDGFLVEIGDIVGFANALIKLANDHLLLKSLSFSAWETTKNRFSYKKTGEAYLELAEKCIAKRIKGEVPKRTGKIDKTLLGDFPSLPILCLRPVRKMLRMFGLFPKQKVEPLLYFPKEVSE
jgi:glycosyltransferase involved in cell wall biosynthesis